MNEKTIIVRGAGSSDVAYTAGSRDAKDSRIPAPMGRMIQVPLERDFCEVPPTQMNVKKIAISADVRAGERRRSTM
jgi:hypothetical protein